MVAFNINKSGRWEHCLYSFSFSVDSVPGVYAIYYKGHLVYIGSTDNLKRRLNEHRKGLCKDWDRQDVFFKLSICPKLGEWLMREHRLIARLRPKLNCKMAAYKRRCAETVFNDLDEKKRRAVALLEREYPNLTFCL